MKRLTYALGLLLASTSLGWAGNPYTAIGNANYSALPSDVRLVPTVALSSTRTITLPSAGGTVVGSGTSIAGGIAASGLATDRFEIIDAFGNVGGSNSCMTITAQTGDLLNGVSGGSVSFCNPYGKITFTPVGGTGWQQSVGSGVFTSVAPGTPVSITSATPINIMSIAIPPGTWSCTGTIGRVVQTSTSFTVLSGVLWTTATAAAPTTTQIGVGQGVYLAEAADVGGTAIGPSQSIGPYVFNLAAAGTLYLAVTDTFTAGTDAGYGNITCKAQP
jgi:hypothetical protein